MALDSKNCGDISSTYFHVNDKRLTFVGRFRVAKLAMNDL